MLARLWQPWLGFVRGGYIFRERIARDANGSDKDFEQAATPVCAIPQAARSVAPRPDHRATGKPFAWTGGRRVAPRLHWPVASALSASTTGPPAGSLLGPAGRRVAPRLHLWFARALPAWTIGPPGSFSLGQLGRRLLRDRTGGSLGGAVHSDHRPARQLSLAWTAVPPGHSAIARAGRLGAVGSDHRSARWLAAWASGPSRVDPRLDWWGSVLSLRDDDGDLKDHYY